MMYKPVRKTAFIHINLKDYEVILKGGCNPLERLKRIAFKVLGGKVISRDKAISLINKISEKVSFNPVQTANAMIEPFGDWVNDGFNCKQYIITMAEHAGVYSNLCPLEPVYMCPECKCLHNEANLIKIPATYSNDNARIALIKGNVVRTDLCYPCIEHKEMLFNDLRATQRKINKAKQGVRNVRKNKQ